jgi:ornithine cyclodeaminase/alanine dehydrogenase-like protein (mu-crystallin family)
MPPLYVTEAEVRRLLTPGEARAAVEGAFERLARGEIDNPARVQLPIPHGSFAVMPCVDRGLGYAGLKTFAWTPGGRPFLVVLISLAAPEIVAILEASALGELRTAAASAVAARHLARPGASTLGVIGCGAQAATHVAALREAIPSLTRVTVYCRSAERLGTFCREHDCDAAGSPAEPGAGDVVVTATTSHDPVLRGEWLQPGATVLAIGGNEPGARELDDAVLGRAAFVCTDSREQGLAESADLSEPIHGGVLGPGDLHELQDVVSGEVRGRRADDEIAVFKSNGLAAWDLAAAAKVVELLRS